MRLRAGSRVLLVALAIALIVGAFAIPATAAHRNQFIRTIQFFESPTAECAVGEFTATGEFEARGQARSCARQFRSPSIVQGSTQLLNGDRLRIQWKVQCEVDQADRPRHFDCRGQWQVDGPNWQGSGNVRIVLDFYAAPYGSADFTFVGNLFRT